MEAVAKSKFVRQSAKKVRRTLGLIRGRDVETALNLLHFAPQKASVVIEKTIHSAVANYLQSDSTEDRDADDLFVKEAFVDEGPTMRRFRPASMGRASTKRLKEQIWVKKHIRRGFDLASTSRGLPTGSAVRITPISYLRISC